MDKLQCFLMLQRLGIKVLNRARTIFSITPDLEVQIHRLANFNNFGPAHCALIVTVFYHLIQAHFRKNILTQNSVSINHLNGIINFN